MEAYPDPERLFRQVRDHKRPARMDQLQGHVGYVDSVLVSVGIGDTGHNHVCRLKAIIVMDSIDNRDK